MLVEPQSLVTGIHLLGIGSRMYVRARLLQVSGKEDLELMPALENQGPPSSMHSLENETEKVLVEFRGLVKCIRARGLVPRTSVRARFAGHARSLMHHGPLCRRHASMKHEKTSVDNMCLAHYSAHSCRGHSNVGHKRPLVSPCARRGNRGRVCYKRSPSCRAQHMQTQPNGLKLTSAIPPRGDG